MGEVHSTLYNKSENVAVEGEVEISELCKSCEMCLSIVIIWLTARLTKVIP